MKWRRLKGGMIPIPGEGKLVTKKTSTAKAKKKCQERKKDPFSKFESANKNQHHALFG